MRADEGAAYHKTDLVDNGDLSVTEYMSNLLRQQDVDYQLREGEFWTRRVANNDQAALADR